MSHLRLQVQLFGPFLILLTSGPPCGWPPNSPFYCFFRGGYIFCMLSPLYYILKIMNDSCGNFGHYIFPSMELISFVRTGNELNWGKTKSAISRSSSFLVLALLAEILEYAHRCVVSDLPSPGLQRICVYIYACPHLQVLPSCLQYGNWSPTLFLSLMCWVALHTANALLRVYLQGLKLLFSSSEFIVVTESFQADFWAFDDSHMWRRLSLFWVLSLNH